MAPSTRASKRAALNLDTSDRAHQATTDNTEPSSPTVPKKSKGRAVHAISSESKASTQTAQEVKSRKRPAQAPKSGGGPSKRQRKLRKQLKNVPPVNSSTSLYTSPQRVGTLCLPTELHQQVLSYTSARDAARYRRVCKSTNRLVVGSENVLLRAYAGGALSRLKEKVDEFNGLETPHDTDSLVEALHVWTKRRGHFADSFSSMGSVLKLIAQFFMKNALLNDQYGDDDPALNERGRTGVCWAYIAKKFLTMLLCPSEALDRDKLFSDLADYRNRGLIDDHEMNKLFDYASEPQLQAANHRLNCHLWPEEKLEYMTFPISNWRLMPILKYPTSYNLETPEVHIRRWPFDDDSLDLWNDYLYMPDRDHLVSQPGLGNEKLVRYLGLPALPNAVSCYYVEDVWARSQIHALVARLYDANRRKQKRVMVAPLLKAAILESVRYF